MGVVSDGHPFADEGVFADGNSIDGCDVAAGTDDDILANCDARRQVLSLIVVYGKEKAFPANGGTVGDVDMLRPDKLGEPSDVDTFADGCETVTHGMLIETVEPHTSVFDD